MKKVRQSRPSHLSGEPLLARCGLALSRSASFVLADRIGRLDLALVDAVTEKRTSTVTPPGSDEHTTTAHRLTTELILRQRTLNGGDEQRG